MNYAGSRLPTGCWRCMRSSPIPTQFPSATVRTKPVEARTSILWECSFPSWDPLDAILEGEPLSPVRLKKNQKQEEQRDQRGGHCQDQQHAIGGQQSAKRP